MLRSISTEPFYRSQYNETFAGTGTSKFVGESNGFRGGFYPLTTTNYKANNETLNTIDNGGTQSKTRFKDINYQSHSLQSRSSIVTFHPD